MRPLLARASRSLRNITLIVRDSCSHSLSLLDKVPCQLLNLALRLEEKANEIKQLRCNKAAMEQGQKGRDIICWHCQGLGHLRSKCPGYQKQKQNKARQGNGNKRAGKGGRGGRRGQRKIATLPPSARAKQNFSVPPAVPRSAHVAQFQHGHLRAALAQPGEVVMEDPGSRMGPVNESPKAEGVVKLTKDGKLISRVQYINSPIKILDLNIVELKPSFKFKLSGLPRFLLHPASDNDFERREWKTFTDFLMKHARVARVLYKAYIFYILPPDSATKFIDTVVLYEVCNNSDAVAIEAKPSCLNAGNLVPLKVISAPCAVKSEGTGESLDEYPGKSKCQRLGANHSPGTKFVLTSGHHNRFESIEGVSCKLQDSLEKNYARTDPSYLKTLGQTHSGWAFGAIAELVDNSRDAKATKLEIFIQSFVKDGKEVPMLSVVDDGHGMPHQEMLRMLSLGRKVPNEDDPSHIGRFGVGFKTGSMRIGQDAIVLTQTTTSRSIGFLSQTLNEGKGMLELPIVSYRRDGMMMEFDTSVQTEATAEYNLKVIKEFSHFNEYLIGALFLNRNTGTQIYIWNLDEWGSNYSLEWIDGNDTSTEGDILIRSKRIRGRPGQISLKVPLDYSLRSYLEVIFLDPRMKIYLQGSPVKSFPLAKFLNKTAIIRSNIMGKSVQLTLGRSQLEWERMNCGIFLYWHGRLIEAYKRVGGMVHNADMGRGVIGVIDVTDIMNDGKNVWVHNHKQGFQDSEVYAKLEEWLGQRTDEYWDTNFDSLQVKKKSASYVSDHKWVQCNKCRKWRILSSGYDINNLPQEWFCYMPPFNGTCATPEQEVDSGVITIAAKRSGGDPKQKHIQWEDGIEGKTKRALHDDSDGSSQTQEEDTRPKTFKRLRRGAF